MALFESVTACEAGNAFNSSRNRHWDGIGRVRILLVDMVANLGHQLALGIRLDRNRPYLVDMAADRPELVVAMELESGHLGNLLPSQVGMAEVDLVRRQSLVAIGMLVRRNLDRIRMVVADMVVDMAVDMVVHSLVAFECFGMADNLTFIDDLIES